MDLDIHIQLTALSEQVQTIGRMIGSKKSDIETLMGMSKCLEDAKTTFDTHIELQKLRYSQS